MAAAILVGIISLAGGAGVLLLLVPLAAVNLINGPIVLFVIRNQCSALAGHRFSSSPRVRGT